MCKRGRTTGLVRITDEADKREGSLNKLDLLLLSIGGGSREIEMTREYWSSFESVDLLDDGTVCRALARDLMELWSVFPEPLEAVLILISERSRFGLRALKPSAILPKTDFGLSTLFL